MASAPGDPHENRVGSLTETNAPRSLPGSSVSNGTETPLLVASMVASARDRRCRCMKRDIRCPSQRETHILSCKSILRSAGVILLLVLAHHYVGNYTRCSRTLQRPAAGVVPKAPAASRILAQSPRRLALHTGETDTSIDHDSDTSTVRPPAETCINEVGFEVEEDTKVSSDEEAVQDEACALQNHSTYKKLLSSARALKYTKLVLLVLMGCMWLAGFLYIIMEDSRTAPRSKDCTAAITAISRNSPTSARTINELSAAVSAASGASSNSSRTAGPSNASGTSGTEIGHTVNSDTAVASVSEAGFTAAAPALPSAERLNELLGTLKGYYFTVGGIWLCLGILTMVRKYLKDNIKTRQREAGILRDIPTEVENADETMALLAPESLESGHEAASTQAEVSQVHFAESVELFPLPPRQKPERRHEAQSTKETRSRVHFPQSSEVFPVRSQKRPESRQEAASTPGKDRREHFAESEGFTEPPWQSSESRRRAPSTRANGRRVHFAESVEVFLLPPRESPEPEAASTQAQGRRVSFQEWV